MQTNLQTSTMQQPLERSARKSSKSSVPLFLAIWMLLIASGVLGTVWYTGKLKDMMTRQIAAQTSRQITALQQNYEAQMKEMQTNFSAELNKVQSKVDALNQLLEFTKDTASTKTDNSNKLYTQLNDVKKQLDELKKSLDVLK